MNGNGYRVQQLRDRVTVWTYARRIVVQQTGSFGDDLVSAKVHSLDEFGGVCWVMVLSPAVP
ncbi:MAG: hypothetical protein H6660_09510 [Ardenticatenaceae bacterium]|nr:hypothetical protein [Ardenticatenaceae bacterium]